MSPESTIAERVAGGDRVVVRNRSQQRWALPALAFFVLMAVIDSKSGTMAIALVAALVVALAAFRPSLVVHSSGVVVTNVLRRHVLTWDEIADVDVRRYSRGETLDLTLETGNHIRCWAVDTGAARNHAWVTAMTLQVAEAWEAATCARSTARMLERYGALA